MLDSGWGLARMKDGAFDGSWQRQFGELCGSFDGGDEAAVGCGMGFECVADWF